MPTSSGDSIEEIAETASGPLWFQHIHYNDRVSELLLPRATVAGYAAIVLTIDILAPVELERRIAAWDQARSGDLIWGSLTGHRELLAYDGNPAWVPPPILWERLEWLRSLSGLPLVLKGVRTVEDARRAVERGADAIVVSNHGGRHFDGSRGAIETLPAISDAVGGDIEVYLDSGIRSGLDVFKALALGARAVLLGRPVLWGLAYAGETGVRRALDIVRTEFERSMEYCGCAGVAAIGREHVNTLSQPLFRRHAGDRP